MTVGRVQARGRYDQGGWVASAVLDSVRSYSVDWLSAPPSDMNHGDYRLSHDPVVSETLYRFVKDLKRTQDVGLTTDNLEKACLTADTDTGTRALVMIGIAEGQWRYDHVRIDLLDQIRRDYQDEVELSRWRTEEQGGRQWFYGRRKASTKAFVSRITPRSAASGEVGTS